MNIDPKWIDQGLDAAEREAGKRLPADVAKGLTPALAELRGLRDPLARLGQPAVEGLLELVSRPKWTRADALDVLARLRAMTPQQVENVKLGAAARAVAGREQYDADVAAVLDGLERAGATALRVLGPMVLASLLAS